MTENRKRECQADRRGAHKTAEKMANIEAVRAWYEEFPESTTAACMKGINRSYPVVRNARLYLAKKGGAK